MINKKDTHILNLMPLRLVCVLAVSAALLLLVQTTLSAKPAPPDADVLDDFPERAASTSDPERFSAIAAPVLPTPSAPITLPETTWRIGIITDGLYALHYPDMAASGVPVTGSAAADFHLLWRGEEIALDGSGLEDTTFDPGDTMFFYGEKYHGSTQDEKYTDENVYWLTVDNAAPGLLMDTRDVNPGEMLPAATMCTGTTAIEENLEYWARFTTYPGTDTNWFWERIPLQTGVTRTYEIDLNKPISTETALLEVEVASKSTYVTTTVKHIVRLTINDTPMGEWSWFGAIGKIIQAVIPAHSLADGSNNLHIYTNDLRKNLYFDRAEITYNRQPSAGPDGLFCDGQIAVPSTYTLTAVPAGARLYDISDNLHPIALTSYITNAQDLVFRESLTREVRYLAQVPVTTIVTAYHPDLDLISPTVGADEIVIAPRDFHTILEPLISLRESQGLRVRVVAVEDIYPLFNGGIFHPEAIRSFVAHAYQNWPAPAPRYLFLVGDGNFNMKGYNPAVYGEFTPSLIPPYLAFDDDFEGEVPVDVLFGDVDSNGLPEVMVGRLPAQTTAEVAAYVDKVLAYENRSLADWHANVLLVADNGGSYDENFDTTLDNLDNDHIPSYITTMRVYQEDYCPIDPATQYTPCPTASLAVTQSWNAGTAMLIYAGHGAIWRWAHEPLLLNTDLTSLTETEKLPFLLSLDCWDGYWMFPPAYPSYQGRDVRSMAEWATTVLTQTGAIASFGPAGLAIASQQEIMSRAMLDRIFKDHELHLGEVTQAGRVAIQTFNLSRIMTLFGDPAMQLKILHLYQNYLPMVVRDYSDA